MKRLSAVAVLALLALLLKLGDSRCGCAAHNGWFEFATHAVWGAEHGHGDERHAAFDHGCGGPACPYYFTGDAPQLESATLMAFWLSPSAFDWDGVALAGDASLGRWLEAPPPDAAPDLAVLQVLRI